MRAQLWTMRLTFGMAGIGISVWAIAVPVTKIRFHLGDGTLGLMLLAGGIGGVAIMPLAGLAAGRFGSRACLVATALLMALLLPCLAIAPSPLAFTALLFAYGATFGALDIALNAQGTLIEARSGRLVMSGFHAAYSLGTLAVALLDSLLIRLGWHFPACALVNALLVLAIATQSFRLVPKATGAPSAKRFVRPNAHALVLGLICYAAFMTEGAATDWSAIFLRFSRGLPLQTATLGYAAFAVSMTLARLTGDHLATRLGQPALLRLGCLVAVAGYALAVLVPDGVVDIAGFALVGFGAGNVVPLVFSAAARVPGLDTHHAMPAVVGLGYAGFLTGPVMIGFLSAHFGLGTAFGANALLLLACLLGARRVA